MSASSFGPLSATQWLAAISSGMTLSRSETTRRMNAEEAILGAQHEPRRYRRPRVEGPRAVVGGVRFGALLAHCLLGKGARHVMVKGDERIFIAGQAAVSPGLFLDG